MADDDEVVGERPRMGTVNMGEEKTMRLPEGEVWLKINFHKSHATLKDRVTYYKADAVDQSGDMKTITTRFAEVKALLDRLEKQLPLQNQLPLFPEAVLKELNNSHLQASFVDQRIKELDRFFVLLWSFPNIALVLPELMKFFTFDSSRAEKRREQRLQGIRSHNTAVFSTTVATSSTKDGVTTYDVCVTPVDGDNTRTLSKRYSDFKAFDTQIRSDYSRNSKQLLDNLAKLPPATLKLFSKHDDEFIETRRQGLDAYLKSMVLLPHAACNVNIFRFFDCWDRY